MNDFGFPEKLIKLTRMKEETKYKVKVDNELSSPSSVVSGHRVKQGDSLPPVLFNLALEKVVIELQNNEGGSNKPKQSEVSRICRWLDIIDDSLENALTTTRHITNEANRIGLQINNDNDETKIMELLQYDEDPGDTEQLLYEKVEDFKYRGATLSTKNRY